MTVMSFSPGLPQADGQLKNRPAVVLKTMPPFGDLLVCGISTQLHQASELDELVEPLHPDFAESGLKAASLIRVGFLAVLPVSSFTGTIGKVSAERYRQLLIRLCEYLRPNEPEQNT